jgi:hypothetical protein
VQSGRDVLCGRLVILKDLMEFMDREAVVEIECDRNNDAITVHILKVHNNKLTQVDLDLCCQEVYDPEGNMSDLAMWLWENAREGIEEVTQE